MISSVKMKLRHFDILGTGNPFDWFENASKSLMSNTVIKKPHQAKVGNCLITVVNYIPTTTI